MTIRECATLQCLESLEQLLTKKERAFRALGNAVNARVVTLITQRMIDSQWTKTDRGSQVAVVGASDSCQQHQQRGELPLFPSLC